MTSGSGRTGRPRRLKVIEVKTIPRAMQKPHLAAGNRFARMSDEERLNAMVELGGRVWAAACAERVRRQVELQNGQKRLEGQARSDGQGRRTKPKQKPAA